MSSALIAHLSSETLAGLALLGPAGFVASWCDVRHRRIPNWLCGATALAGLGAALIFGGGGPLASQAAHMVLALLVGMGLFALGGFGGGDAKFYAAAAAWFGLAKALLLLICVALSGLLLLIVWFIFRRARGIPVRRSGNDPFDGVPYGVAIASGGILALLI